MALGINDMTLGALIDDSSFKWTLLIDQMGLTCNDFTSAMRES